MPLPVYHLRRLLAATAVILTAVVLGMYFYARSRATNVLKTVPSKIGYDIKQTANGFQFSKSDGKRTLFSMQASDVKQFKLDGRAELHNVNIILYGRDSSRFDRISGDDFAYDQKTGNVTAHGEVQIDLAANPAGLTSPDQSTPEQVRNPIHLKTRDLVFNRDSGNASTDARVDFSTPQATGWAVGVEYAGKTNTLTLGSEIHVTVTGSHAAVIRADHGVVTNDPRQIVLDRPQLDRQGGTLQADRAVFHLDDDNNVQSVLASGDVKTETRMTPRGGAAQPNQASEIRGRADQAEFLLTGEENLLRTATLTGNVRVEQSGAQPIQGDAGRVVLEFAGQNELQKVHALDGARLVQKASPSDQPVAKKSGSASTPQDFQLTAPVIDFIVAGGQTLERAETSGDARITITPSQPPAPGSQTSDQRTVVTAGKFEAKFAADQAPGHRKSAAGRGYLSSVHGAPQTRIVSSVAGHPDRVSTSDAVDATFLPQGGVDFMTQTGNFFYSDGESPDKRMQAWASNARYTPGDQMVVLTGAPRVTSGSMSTTAKTIRIARSTGDALADGDVKSSYSELKEQPNGALLASSSPIHVTASSMSAHRNGGEAVYTGNARLWQDANVIEAPSIQFDRDHRSVLAQGTPAAPVLTTLVQGASKKLAAVSKTGENSGGVSPIAISANRLTYADLERRIHYETGVSARGADFTASGKTLDAFLLPRSQTSSNQSIAGPGQIDRMVAQGDVVIQQPHRRAEGQKLVYTPADDKFVLTGGPPSIFDAERGKITGVSLTFFRGDDRVLVEGEASTPVVTQTRVAR
jgi:lipopolysaccharide export system protein LptA